jgi:hypothetical protein
MLVLALGLAITAVAEDSRSESEQLYGFSPGSPFLVVGPIFEEVRGPIEGDHDFLGAKSGRYMDKQKLSGKYVTSVHYEYRDQPPEFQTYIPANSLTPIVYMTTQFKPRSYSGFVRVDFNAQVSVVPGPGGFAGVSYALWIKEDGGNGHISNPGEVDCGGDDICGYLEQTIYSTWLVGSTNEEQYNSVATSNFFKARSRRKLEIQVHLFIIYDPNFDPGLVTVNSGFIGLTSGK